MNDEIILNNIALVHHIAKKYKGIAEYEDLVSEGIVGLVEASKRIDSEKGNVSSYLGSYISGYMLRYINTVLPMIRTPYQKENMYQVISYDSFVSEDNDDSTLSGCVGYYDDSFDEVIVKCDFENAMKKLGKRDRYVYEQLAKGYTMNEIAEAKGVSRTSVYALRDYHKRELEDLIK